MVQMYSMPASQARDGSPILLARFFIPAMIRFSRFSIKIIEYFFNICYYDLKDTGRGNLWNKNISYQKKKEII